MKRTAYVIILLLSLSSCEKKLGKYVYVDVGQILHTDNQCDNIFEADNAKPVRVLLVEKLKRGNWQYVCSRCVNDKFYGDIEKQIETNIVAEEKRKAFFRKLYDRLSDVGENQWYHFEGFCNYVSNKDNFRRLVTQLQEKGYDVDKWIEEDFGLNDRSLEIEELDSLAT